MRRTQHRHSPPLRAPSRRHRFVCCFESLNSIRREFLCSRTKVQPSLNQLLLFCVSHSGYLPRWMDKERESKRGFRLCWISLFSRYTIKTSCHCTHSEDGAPRLARAHFTIEDLMIPAKGYAIAVHYNRGCMRRPPQIGYPMGCGSHTTHANT